MCGFSRPRLETAHIANTQACGLDSVTWPHLDFGGSGKYSLVHGEEEMGLRISQGVCAIFVQVMSE